MKWVQVYDPLGNIFLSALIAAIPLMILLYMLGVRRAKGHHAAMIGSWLSGLTARAGVVGLCSADFIRNRDGYHLIEINPRPGATSIAAEFKTG